MNMQDRRWRWLFITAGAAGGAAILLWTARLHTLEALVLVFVVTTLADAIGIWWEERAQAKRARGAPAGVVKLVGAEGVVTVPCAPAGRVRIGLELWDARCGGSAVVPAGQRVIVLDFDGGTLLVEPTPRDSHA